MTTNTKMMSIIEFTTTFIRENGSEKMIKQWESKATKAELKKLTFSDKKIKDPDAPKGALSAYMFFCKDQRSAVQNDIGDNAREITKELGSRWNTLKESHSNGKEKKQWEMYEKEAVKDKQRRKDEMDEYVPPTKEYMEKLKKTSSKSKDSNAPKAPKSSYIFFTLEERVKIKEDTPSMGGADVMVELGVRWKDLKSDRSRTEQMNTYIVLASNDKERYNKEMALYKETKEDTKEETNGETNGETKADNSDTEVDESDTEVDPKPKNTQKKTSNYMNYCTKLRPTVRKENPSLKGVDVTMKLKEMWGELSQEDRDEYQ